MNNPPPLYGEKIERLNEVLTNFPVNVQIGSKIVYQLAVTLTL